MIDNSLLVMLYLTCNQCSMMREGVMWQKLGGVVDETGACILNSLKLAESSYERLLQSSRLLVMKACIRVSVC